MSANPIEETPVEEKADHVNGNGDVAVVDVVEEHTPSTASAGADPAAVAETADEKREELAEAAEDIGMDKLNLPFDSLDLDGDGVPDVYFDAYADLPISSEEIAARPIPMLDPANVWPPPIFINPTASAREIYYMQHRWYAQWNYYDSKASAAKTKYQRLQLIVAVGSVVVPVLVGLTPTDPNLRTSLDLLTVGVSLIVAAAAAIETVKQFGDEWRNFRSTAEELKREKSLYDTGSGPYRRAKNPFRLFVERSEEVMAKQNGAWAALKEESMQDKDAEEDEGIGVTGTNAPMSTSSTTNSNGAATGDFAG